MSLPHINFIGCGRLGQTIAYLLQKNQLAIIQSVHNRTPTSTNNAIAFIGQGEACLDLKACPPADFYFFCTPDDQIEKSHCDLLTHTSPPKNSVFVHCSGALTSSAFGLAKERGYLTASFHTMQSFAAPSQANEALQGFWSLEGDTSAKTQLATLFSPLGITSFELSAEKKALYHVAGVFTSHYMTILAEIAMDCYKEVAISNDISKTLVLQLMKTTLQNLMHRDTFAKAATGPLPRGDAGTLKKHIATLKENTPYTELYQQLAKIALDKSNHTEAKKKELLEALNPP